MTIGTDVQPIRRRVLGRTELQVSEVGFGAWAVGGPTESGGVPLGWGTTSDDESLATIRRARDLGVNFFDTADIYGFGRSEALLGIVLARQRRDVVLATKVGNVRASDGSIRKDFSKRHILYAINGSLRRLRTDYVDLYLAHNPMLDDLRRGEIQEAMDQLQEAGKIRYWGVSVNTPEEGIEVILQGWGYALQVLYNILNQSPARELFPLAKKKGWGIISRVPLASGLLTGKYRRDAIFPPNDVRQNFLTPRRLAEALDRVDEIRGILGRSVQSLAQGAIRFALEDEAVSTTIPGARNPRQVEMNAGAAAVHLTPEVVAKLRQRLGDFDFYERHGIRV